MCISALPSNNYVFVILNYWIFQGTYITPGVDLQKLKDHNFPKVYFYGKCKMPVKIKNK